MGVLEVASRSTYRKDLDEKWNEYERTETGNYIIVHRTGKERSGKRKMLEGSAEPFYGQGVKNMARSARANAKPRECRKGERKTCLHGSYNRLVFRGSKVRDCAVLKEIILSALEVLSQSVLDIEVDELRKQEQSDREQLARKTEKPEKKLEAAKRRTAKLEEAVRENGTSQGTKRRTEKRRSNSGSERSPKAKDSSEMRNPALEKGKQNLCGLCCKMQ